jgi:hypothetical protein
MPQTFLRGSPTPYARIWIAWRILTRRPRSNEGSGDRRHRHRRY